MISFLARALFERRPAVFWHIFDFVFLAFFLFYASPSINAQEVGGNPLAPVKTDSPRDTMRSFLEAMNDYRRGVETGDSALEDRIFDAVRCLNLSDVSVILREEQGREAAIFLKEVIDRVIVVDYRRIPHTKELSEAAKAGNPFHVWRLRKTDIRIGLVEKGERTGEWLFTPNTVYSARRYYNKIKEKPYLKGSGMGAGYRAPWFEKRVPAWMKQRFLALGWWQWAGLFLSVLIGLMLKQVVKYIIEFAKKFTSRSKSQWDDLILKAVASPVGYLAACLFWFVALRLLNFEGNALSITNVILKIVFSTVLVWLSYRLADVLTRWLRKLAEQTESTLDDQLVPLFSRTIKIMVLILGVLISIQNLGVNVLSLLAGLGIGGLAFALAAKDTVANFFGSLMILFDRPFQVGDWIRVSNEEGTVEEIGFRSTRIRTFYNSLISIPNSKIANTNIDNLGARKYRRDRKVLGVTYDTEPELLELFLEGIKNIIKANPHTRKDYFHVVFSGFGDSALEIMIYYFFEVPDWSNELVEKQNIYLEILRLAKKLGVEFAWPTQTLHIESMPGKKPAREPTKVVPARMKKLVRDFGPKGKASMPSGLGYFTPPFREEGGDVRKGGEDS